MIHHSFFECHVEICIVEKDVWVVKPSVEMTLDGLYRLYDTCQLLVPSEDYKNSVGSWSLCVWLQAACDENLVMFLTDLAAKIVSSSFLSVAQAKTLERNSPNRRGRSCWHY